MLSGKYGIYPVSALVYWMIETLEKEGSIGQYRSKIDMQISVIGECRKNGLHFSCVTGDIWYFTKRMIDGINSMMPG